MNTNMTRAVEDALAVAIRAVDGNHNRGAADIAERVLAHPGFRKQVAELMRGMVPRPDGFGPPHALVTETLARIAEWESAK